jgi:hypothetical protein
MRFAGLWIIPQANIIAPLSVKFHIGAALVEPKPAALDAQVAGLALREAAQMHRAAYPSEPAIPSP